MSSELDKALEEIQKELWDEYTEIVIDHAQNPRNVGRMPNADGYASVTGPCGDTMDIWLKVSDVKIKEARFLTDGCGTTIAAIRDEFGSLERVVTVYEAVKPSATPLSMDETLKRRPEL